jgi:endonuclease YncB( thermonuclease family)
MKPSHVALALLAATAVTSAGIAWYAFSSPYAKLDRVVDGDTLIIDGGTTVRLWGIDAPELEQTCVRDMPRFRVRWDCGKVSRDYLRSFFKAHVKLRCEPQSHPVAGNPKVKSSRDAHGRTVAKCYAVNVRGEEHDIARSLVSAGYAFDWLVFSSGGYAAEEAYARRHKLGLWSGAFDYPWDWRQEHN